MSGIHVTDFFATTKRGNILAIDPKIFDELDKKKREGHVIMTFQDGPVDGLAAHPFRSQFAVCGGSGLIQLWDYTDAKKLRVSRYTFTTYLIHTHILAYIIHTHIHIHMYKRSNCAGSLKSKWADVWHSINEEST